MDRTPSLRVIDITVAIVALAMAAYHLVSTQHLLFGGKAFVDEVLVAQAELTATLG